MNRERTARRERSGYRLFRATYKDRGGKQRESSKWYAEFRDHQEKVRRVPLFTAQKVSADAAERLVQLVADVQVNGKLCDAELVRWSTGLPESIRETLGKIGLLEAERMGMGRGLPEHIEDFHAALLAKGNTPKQARLVKTRVQAIVDGCHFKRVSDITAGRVARLLADLRTGREDSRGISQRTSNFYVGAMNQFCRWLLRERRMNENPMAGAERLKVTDAMERRALTVDEQSWLLSVTKTQSVRFGVSGTERAIIYRTALGTGFRASELASLKRRDFRLDTDAPEITLAAGASKNRKGAVQPIARELANVLAEFLKLKAPDAKAFAMPPNCDTADMLYADLNAAREAWIDAAPSPADRKTRTESQFLVPDTDEGRADFHALRHTFISALAAGGVHPKDAQALARHSSISLTMDRYTHVVRGRLSTALNALPTIPEPAVQTARKLGTNDLPATTPTNTGSVLAVCLAETGTRGKTLLDSTGQASAEPENAQPVAVTAESTEPSAVTGVCHRSSVGQSSGFVNRRRTDATPCQPATSESDAACLGVRLAVSDPDLKLIVERWPSLAPAVRKALGQMVRAAAEKGQ